MRRILRDCNGWMEWPLHGSHWESLSWWPSSERRDILSGQRECWELTIVVMMVMILFYWKTLWRKSQVLVFIWTLFPSLEAMHDEDYKTMIMEWAPLQLVITTMMIRTGVVELEEKKKKYHDLILVNMKKNVIQTGLRTKRKENHHHLGIGWTVNHEGTHGGWKIAIERREKERHGEKCSGRQSGHQIKWSNTECKRHCYTFCKHTEKGFIHFNLDPW